MKNLSMMVAMTPERIIGDNNALPWRLPSDLRRFRERTIEERIIIMGSTTFLSIFGRRNAPLPLRHHVVLSTRLDPANYPGVEMVRSVEEALDAVDALPACVIGGARIYAEFLPRVSRLYLTTVHAVVAGDTLFPLWNQREWRPVVAIPRGRHDEKDEFETSYTEYTRN